MKKSYKKMCLLAMLIAVLSVAAAFPSFCREAAADSKEKKAAAECAVSSRECKMLLLAAKFSDHKAAMKDFWYLVDRAGSAVGLKVKKIDASDREKTFREVSFMDTKNFDLYKNCYILRRRVEDGDIGMTLKYRNPDLVASSKADVSPAAGHDEKTAMDEDVVVKEKMFERVFSKSGKTVVKADSEPTIGAYAEVYPGMLKLGIPEKTPLSVVNGVKIDETNIEYGSIHLSKNVKAEAFFTIWRIEGSDDVFIVEFSYRYKFEDSPSEEELLVAHHASDKFLGKLRDSAKSWLAVGLTKTGMVYKFNASNAD